MPLTLYTYFRSSAAYRVRIALHLKGVEAEQRFVHLVRGGGEQNSADYARINPNRTVPALDLGDGSAAIMQSLAIIEYLDETMPAPPLLPGDAAMRARIRAAAQIIACDIHPVNNARVGAYLRERFGRSQDDVIAWMQHWMRGGLEAFQAVLPPGSPYCFGEAVTLADLLLVPQMYNARRWGMPAEGLERLAAIEEACLKLDAFARARPENQPDAE
ncbi:maleylacetoacetate isomerase [Rhabdaerophilum calidifontis]|uniref:maleylacetoacetate isomerase n=1 Tax=Rhabdaerophilum calidifontis TaxID=2604328 RepID=UPI00319E6590